MQLYPVTNFWLAMPIGEGLPGENRGIEYFKIEQSLPDLVIYKYICVKGITEPPECLYLAKVDVFPCGPRSLHSRDHTQGSKRKMKQLTCVTYEMSEGQSADESSASSITPTLVFTSHYKLNTFIIIAYLTISS